jgi:hypothetical protein
VGWSELAASEEPLRRRTTSVASRLRLKRPSMSSATVAMNRAGGGGKKGTPVPAWQPCPPAARALARSSDHWRGLLLAAGCRGAVCMQVPTRAQSACTAALPPPAPHLHRRTPGAARGAHGACTAGLRDTRVRLRRGAAPAAMAVSTLAKLQQSLNLAGMRLFLTVALVCRVLRV